MNDDELSRPGALKKKLFQVKEQAVKRNQILELLDYKNVSTEIGGLRGLKEYIEEISGSIKEERRFRETYGTEMSKGILVCGIPGCGKSLAARFVARKLELPLLKLDVGMLMGKYQGESEHNMQQALRIAHKTAFFLLGEVIEYDDTEKIFSNPSNPKTEEYVTGRFG